MKRNIEIVESKSMNGVVYPNESFVNTSKTVSGFLIGNNGLWHNGLHTYTNEPIKSVYEGEVVAIRLRQWYEFEEYEKKPIYDDVKFTEELFLNEEIPLEMLETKYFTKDSDNNLMLRKNLSEEDKQLAYNILNAAYSNSFVLLKHKVHTLTNDIVFYSLYNHLTPRLMLDAYQLNSMPWFLTKIQLNKYQENGLVAFLDCDSRYPCCPNKTTKTKAIDCETAYSNGDVIFIKWNMNGNTYSCYIESKYLREDLYETKRLSKNNPDGNQFLKTNDRNVEIKYDLIPIFNSDNPANRNVVATIDKKSMLSSITFTNKDISDCLFQGFKEEKNPDYDLYPLRINYNKNESGYVYFSREIYSELNQNFKNLLKIQGSVFEQNTEPWTFFNGGLTTTNYNTKTLTISSQSMLSEFRTTTIKVIDIETKDYKYIPAETKYILGTNDENNKYEFIKCIINNENREGFVLKSYLDSKNMKIKRIKTPEDTNDSKYVKENNVTLIHKIPIYTTDNRESRKIQGYAEKNTEFTLCNFNDFVNIVKAPTQIKAKGIRVKYYSSGYHTGFIFFDIFKNRNYNVTEYKNEIERFLRSKNNNERNTYSFFDGLLSLKTEKNTDFFPSEKYCGENENEIICNGEKYPDLLENLVSLDVPTINKGTIIGYAGYKLTDDENQQDLNPYEMKNEDATSVHVEIFTPDVKFMKFSGKEKTYSAKVIVKKEDCWGHNDNITTVTINKPFTDDDDSLLNSMVTGTVTNYISTVTKSIKGLFSIKKKTSDKLENLVNTIDDNLTNNSIEIKDVYFKIDEKDFVELVPGEKFFKIQKYGSIIRLESDQYIYYSYDGYDEQTNSHTVLTEKLNLQVYDINNKIVENKTVNLYPGYIYPLAAKKDTKGIRLRRAKFYYEPKISSNIYYISSSTLEKFEKIGDYSIVKSDNVLKSDELFFKPLTTKWKEGEKQIPLGEYTYLNNKCTDLQGVQWEQIQKDNTNWWIKSSDVSTQIDCKEKAEKIIYNDWNYFFTELKDKDKTRCNVNNYESLLTKIGVTDKDVSSFKNKIESIENNPKNKAKVKKELKEECFIETIRNNKEKLYSIYYKDNSEWRGNNEYLTEIENSMELDKVETEILKNTMKKCAFWEEVAKKSKNSPLPQNYYFHPTAFLSHLSKVAQTHAEELMRVQKRIVNLKCLQRGGVGPRGLNKSSGQTWCNYAVFFTIRALDEDYTNFTDGKNGIPDKLSDIKNKEYRDNYPAGLKRSNVWCDVLAYLGNSNDSPIKEITEHKIAQQFANMGYVVICSWKNLRDTPQDEASPHFATIYPSNTIVEKKENILIANVGYTCGCNKFQLSQGFSSNRWKDVRFFYNSDQKFREDYDIGGDKIDENIYYPSIKEMEKSL